MHLLKKDGPKDKILQLEREREGQNRHAFAKRKKAIRGQFVDMDMKRVLDKKERGWCNCCKNQRAHNKMKYFRKKEKKKNMLDNTKKKKKIQEREIKNGN